MSRTRSRRTPRVAGSSIVRTLVGHGVGRDMHEDPQIPNFGDAGHGPRLLEGMVLAIEPMTTAGGPEVRIGYDGWAIYSQDGSLTAHFEFTVAITAEGPRVMTPWHLADGEEPLVGNIRVALGSADPGAFVRNPRAVAAADPAARADPSGSIRRGP